MARRPSIDDNRIVEAARQLFLKKGIRATTAEVAQKARVAEGSIFNRFKSKHELFLAAMQAPGGQPAWLASLESRVGAEDLQKTLVELGMEILEFLRSVLPVMMMSWSNPIRRGLRHIFKFPNPPPLVALKKLAGFFEAEMRAGRLARHDPEIVARSYLGSIQNYVFFELLLKAQDELPLPAETYLRGVIAMMWRGLNPAPRRE